MIPFAQETTLETLNNADEHIAAELLLPFIERAPDLARAVARHRPFHSAEAIIDALREEISKLASDELMSLFRAHPELSPPTPEAMTDASQYEQGRLGLSAPSPELRKTLARLNAAYQAKFQFPFILALHRMDTIEQILEAFEMRLSNKHSDEIAQACAEITSVSAARVRKAFAKGALK